MPICLECGKEFEKTVSKGKHVFCSRECGEKNWYKNNQEHIREYVKSKAIERNARQRERYANDFEYREKTKKDVRDYNARNPNKKRQSYIKSQAKKYGIDEYELEILLDEGCMVCGAGSAYDVNVELHIDHDHRTGKFRGILCQSCNLALGNLYDNPITISNLLNYIMKGSYNNEE